MPIVVDREERRSRVISVAFDLIADRGIEGLTFKEIAAATDCSTSIVSYYFRNKNELLFSVYRLANERARERLEAGYARGLPLVTCFDAILPIGEDSERNWRVWLTFWARAHLEPAYSEERRIVAQESQKLYRSMLAERMGCDRDHPAIMLAARKLIAAVAGIGLEACFAPDDWTADRMREVLSAVFDDIGLSEE